MQYINVNDIKGNVICARPIFKENILKIKANVIIKEKDKYKLSKNNIENIYIYNTTDVDFLYKSLDDNYRNKRIENNEITYDELCFVANCIMYEVSKIRYVKNILKIIKNTKNNIYHKSNKTAFYSLILGIKYGLNTFELKELCIAALLHDYGLIYYNKNATESKNSKTGYLKLKNFFSNEIAKAILYQYDNEENTPLFAKIIKISNYYIELTEELTLPMNDVIEFFYSSNNLFDNDILKTFLKTIEFYTPGKNIILSNGDKAKIIKHNNDFPTRPIIKWWTIKIDLSKFCYNTTIIK